MWYFPSFGMSIVYSTGSWKYFRKLEKFLTTPVGLHQHSSYNELIILHNIQFGIHHNVQFIIPHNIEIWNLKVCNFLIWKFEIWKFKTFESSKFESLNLSNFLIWKFEIWKLKIYRCQLNSGRIRRQFFRWIICMFPNVCGSYGVAWKRNCPEFQASRWITF